MFLKLTNLTLWGYGLQFPIYYARNVTWKLWLIVMDRTANQLINVYWKLPDLELAVTGVSLLETTVGRPEHRI